MKKISLVGLFSVGLFFGAVSVNAETATTQSSTATAETVTSSSEESATEGVTTNSSVNDSALDTGNESGDVAEVATELAHTASPSATYVKGASPKPEDFKAALEQVLKMSFKSLMFIEESDRATDTVGLHPTKILAYDEIGKAYIITCTYAVTSDVATLSAPTITYEEKTDMISGTTLPNHDVYFYYAGLESSDPVLVLQADATGAFSSSAAIFTRGAEIAAIVYSAGGFEFSEAVTFQLPVIYPIGPSEISDTSSSSTSVESSSQESSTTSTSSSSATQETEKTGLPKTGDSVSSVLQLSGLTALIASAFVFFRRHNKKA